MNGVKYAKEPGGGAINHILIKIFEKILHVGYCETQKIIKTTIKIVKNRYYMNVSNHLFPFCF